MMSAISHYLYFAFLLTLSLGLLSTVLCDKFASPAGKVLALVGSLALLVGIDGVMGDLLGLLDGSADAVRGGGSVPTFDPAAAAPAKGLSALGQAQVSAGWGWFMVCTGAIAVYVGLVSWIFTPAEKHAARTAHEKAQEKATADRQAYRAQGTVTTVRNHVAKGGALSSTERFTEIETTTGVFVVEGEVGSMAKGLAVYKNGMGQLRVGGLHSRTFELRRSPF